MKKILLTLGLLLFMAGCAGGQNQEVIHVFNWGYFVDQEVLNMFEEEYGIRVIYTTYESNEIMYNMVVMGGNVYDVIFPSDYMIYRMIAEGLLQRINFDNVPNIVHIDPQFMDLPFDPGNLYSAPYKWGTLGILYNTTLVSSVVDSWEALWNEDYAGMIFMYNSKRDALGAALKKLGFSMNTTNEDELNQAVEILIQQGPLVRAYVTDQVMQLMIGGEGALALAYSGCAVFSISHNPDLNYVIPREGSNLWVDSMVIPHNANNPRGAEAFINFMLRPEIAAMNTNYVRYTTANLTALESGLIDPDLMAINGFFVTPEEYARLEVFVDLGDFRDVYDRAFTTVLNSIN